MPTPVPTQLWHMSVLCPPHKMMDVQSIMDNPDYGPTVVPYGQFGLYKVGQFFNFPQEIVDVTGKLIELNVNIHIIHV